jgi:HD-like signal output (HDOD) protein
MSLGRDTIISLGSKLPPAIGILGRLQALLQDPDTDLDDIVELVNVDPGLTFQVIKLSNSALYGLKTRCQSLDEAVARIGFGEIHQLVGLAVSRQVFQGELAFYGIAAGRLWENSVAGGALMLALARSAGTDQGAAYAAGLLRNIGRVVLNNFPGAVRYPGEAARPDVFAWERETHSISAPEVTAILLDHWRFAPEITGAVCGHVAPVPQSEFATGAALLHVACACAAEWGCALPGETGWRKDAAMLALTGVPEDSINGAIQDARAMFARFSLLEWSQAA